MLGCPACRLFQVLQVLDDEGSSSISSCAKGDVTWLTAGVGVCSPGVLPPGGGGAGEHARRAAAQGERRRGRPGRAARAAAGRQAPAAPAPAGGLLLQDLQGASPARSLAHCTGTALQDAPACAMQAFLRPDRAQSPADWGLPCLDMGLVSLLHKSCPLKLAFHSPWC